MKKYLSVLAIASRSTIYKLMGLLLVMAVAEILAFQYVLNSDKLYSLEMLMTQSKISLISAIAFISLCVLLSTFSYETSGSKIRYTIQRLSISDQSTVSLWALHNGACFIIFWAANLLVVLFLCHQYTISMPPEYLNSQTLFLAFYKTPYLHGLLPLEETSLWIRNIVFVIALGITSASLSLKQRRGKKGFAISILAVIVCVTFSKEIGDLIFDILTTLIALSMTVYALFDIWRGDLYDY